MKSWYDLKEQKLKRRKETIQSLLILALVLGLGAVCVLTYLHARGGFLR
jgi:hypothetical protein